MRKFSLLFQVIVLLNFFGCQKENSIQSHFSEKTIDSRDNGVSILRHPLYLAKVPMNWIVKTSSPDISVNDTMKPLIEYLIEDEGNTIKITIHNFPIKALEERTPPGAQINRWRNQFDSLTPSLTFTTTQSHDGFIGLFLEAEGILNNEPAKMLGWAMQLAPEYCEQLNFQEMSFLSKQACSSYTIKAVGTPSIIKKHQKDIIIFANSFALINDLSIFMNN